jgi:hypothetical protein
MAQTREKTKATTSYGSATAFMGALLLVLLGATVLVAIVLARKRFDYGARAQGVRNGAPHQPAKPDSLPDSLHLADDVALRSWLIDGCLIALDTIKVKYASDMLLGMNCDAAKARALEDYGRVDVSPLMLGASLVPRGAEPTVLAFHALNVRRETDRLLIVGKTPAGAILRVVYHFGIVWKDSSLVAQRMVLVRKVSPDEIQRLGDVKQVTSGSEVHLPFRFHLLPVPDISPLAAAVEDRSGRTSNFVVVFEARGDPASDRETDRERPGTRIPKQSRGDSRKNSELGR